MKTSNTIRYHLSVKARK